MSKRYGRNQKRKHRETIARLRNSYDKLKHQLNLAHRATDEARNEPLNKIHTEAIKLLASYELGALHELLSEIEKKALTQIIATATRTSNLSMLPIYENRVLMFTVSIPEFNYRFNADLLKLVDLPGVRK